MTPAAGRALAAAILAAAGLAAASLAAASDGAARAARAAGPAAGPPDILLVTVDTLRADHLSLLGHPRTITPRLDRLLSRGVAFEQARTVEPLTNPALASLLTSLHPHEHGAPRNGLRIRTGLLSLPKILAATGYETAAFLGNWTLREKLSGLDEHFGLYEPILSRRRWFGLVRSESDADDMTEAALDWLAARRGRTTPFLLWVHYADPHAPYVYRPGWEAALGVTRREAGKRERYATEVAFTDGSIGRLLDGIAGHRGRDAPIIIFAADHGESLGEHDAWGHGRNLFEEGLRIPMGIVWDGRLAPRRIARPAMILDLAPTLLGLLDLPVPESFRGYDWSGVLLRGEPPPESRATLHQAHKGAIQVHHDSDKARRVGLLQVAVIHDGVKEILSVDPARSVAYDLRLDRREARPLERGLPARSRSLAAWAAEVRRGLAAVDRLPAEPLDEESLKRLRALGYVD